jgi:hypothetical protein
MGAQKFRHKGLQEFEMLHETLEGFRVTGEFSLSEIRKKKHFLPADYSDESQSQTNENDGDYSKVSRRRERNQGARFSESIGFKTKSYYCHLIVQPI